MQAALHPLPPHAGFCLLIPGFLSAHECAALVEQGEARGFTSASADYPPSYRDNERQVLDDRQFAGRMFDRLKHLAPATLPGPADAPPDEIWRLEAINERLRFCRYLAGQQFRIHQDGVHHRGDGLQSRLTFMVYLSDPDVFGGGDTVFFAGRPGTGLPGEAVPEIGRVRPKAGSLILFDHALWHAGDIVTAGVKHILRSDLIYRRHHSAIPSPPEPFRPGHAGYVWTMARLDAHTLASGGRDAAIRLWDTCGRSQGMLGGHRQSVLGLAALPERRLASVSRDRRLIVWDWARGRIDHDVVAHDAAALCVTSLPGRALATGGADGLVKQWSDGGECVATLAGHCGWVWDVVPLGETRLVSASEDGSARIWNLQTGQCLQTLPGRVPLRSVAGSPDASHVITADNEGSMTAWRDTGHAWVKSATRRAHAASMRRVRWMGTDRLGTAGEDGMVRLWQWPQMRCVGESRHTNFVTDLLALDGEYLSCAYDGHIRRGRFP